jgi:hypothetical protein
MTTSNAPEARMYGATLEMRDVQAIGKPYRYLEGRAVPFDTWGELAWFREMHARDSLKRSTGGGTGRALPLLLFHDNRTWPIGQASEWINAEDGLHGVWQLNDRPEAQEGAKLAERGDLVGMSIGFAPIRSEWTYCDDWDPALGPEHKDTVVRTESRLLEVSLTPTPVFEDAEVLGVRTAFDIAQRSSMARERNRREADAWRTELEGLRSPPS